MLYEVITKGTRLLGIPTVTDRLLQQAVLQVIAACFKFEFSDSSYGFRPGRNVQQAVLKAQGYINEGFPYIVDIDLKTFFDEVDHRYLLQLLYRKIKSRETRRLIRKCRITSYNVCYTKLLRVPYGNGLVASRTLCFMGSLGYG